MTIKQTALQWFLDKLPHSIETQFSKQIQQAMQMEREQIELAFDEGLEYEYEHHINGYPRIEPSTYYNETYGGKDE